MFVDVEERLTVKQTWVCLFVCLYVHMLLWQYTFLQILFKVQWLDWMQLDVYTEYLLS